MAMGSDIQPAAETPAILSIDQLSSQMETHAQFLRIISIRASLAGNKHDAEMAYSCLALIRTLWFRLREL
jgi:hypothetical protein